jgi:hypothetical protein
MKGYENNVSCVCFPTKILKKLLDFHEIVYGYYDIGGNPNSMLVNFLRSAVTIRRANLFGGATLMPLSLGLWNNEWW